MFQRIARIILVAGLAIAAVGAVVHLLERAGLGLLPGDVSVGGKGWHVYLPVTTCLMLSAALTLLVYLVYLVYRSRRRGRAGGNCPK